MSAIYGIAGFVDGLVRGREVKNSWQDRKDQKERQKKLDELLFTQDARAAEAHNASMAAEGRTAQEWQRAWDYQTATDAANAEAVAAAEAAMAQDAALGAGPVASAPPQSPPIAFPQPNRTAEAFDRLGGIPVPQPLGAVASSPQASTGAGGGASATASLTNPQTVPQDPTRARRLFVEGFGEVLIHQNGRIYDVRSGREVSDPLALGIVQEAMRAGSQADVAPGKIDPLGLMPNPNHNWGESLVPDVAEAGRRGLAGLGAAEGAVANIAKGAANAVNSVVNPVAQYATGGAVPELGAFTGNGWETKAPSEIRAAEEKATAERGLQDLSASWKRATTPRDPAVGGASIEAPLKSNVPASAPVATKQLAATATDAMAATATPAMQATAQTAPGPASLGVKPGDKLTETQRAKAAKGFMDHYREVGAPIVIKDMLKRGDMQGAMAFQEFLDRDATKAGMENWARAAFAAQVGDMDTFADEILTAYNRLDYFPDGTTIVKGESGFTYDKKGNISGAKITFKDEATGNTFDQVFSDPNDLVRLGITMLAPEAAFEHYSTQLQSQAQIAATAGQKSEQKAADTQKQILAAAKVIMETSVGLDGKPTKTYEQAIAEAQAAIGGLGALPSAVMPPVDGSGGPPPVAYRP